MQGKNLVEMSTVRGDYGVNTEAGMCVYVMVGVRVLSSSLFTINSSARVALPAETEDEDNAFPH